jgi:uncharacterized RDD family membrane protein YckC
MHTDYLTPSDSLDHSQTEDAPALSEAVTPLLGAITFLIAWAMVLDWIWWLLCVPRPV